MGIGVGWGPGDVFCRGIAVLGRMMMGDWKGDERLKSFFERWLGTIQKG